MISNAILKKIENNEHLGDWTKDVEMTLRFWIQRDLNRTVTEVQGVYLFNYLVAQLDKSPTSSQSLRDLIQQICSMLKFSKVALCKIKLKEQEKPIEKRIFQDNLEDMMRSWFSPPLNSDVLSFLANYFYPQKESKQDNQSTFANQREIFDNELANWLIDYTYYGTSVESLIGIINQDTFPFNDRPKIQGALRSALTKMIETPEYWQTACSETVCHFFEKHPEFVSSEIMLKFVERAVENRIECIVEIAEKNRIHHIAGRLVCVLYAKEIENPEKIVVVLQSAMFAGEQVIKLRCYQSLMGVAGDAAQIKSLAELAKKEKEAFLKLVKTSPLIGILKEHAKTNANARDELGEIYYQAWLLEPSQLDFLHQTLHFTRSALQLEEGMPLKSSIERMKDLRDKSNVKQVNSGALEEDDATIFPAESLQLVKNMSPALDALLMHVSRAKDEEEKVASKIKELEEKLIFNHEELVATYRQEVKAAQSANIKTKLLNSIQESKEPNASENSLWTLHALWLDLNMQYSEIAIIAGLLENFTGKELKSMAPFTPTLAFLFYEKVLVRRAFTLAGQDDLLTVCLMNFNVLSSSVRKSLVIHARKLLERVPKIFKQLSHEVVLEIIAMSEINYINCLVQADAHFAIRRSLYLKLMGQNPSHYEHCETVEALIFAVGDFYNVSKIFSPMHDLESVLNSPEGYVELAELYFYAWKLRPEYRWIEKAVENFCLAMGQSHRYFVLNLPDPPFQKPLMFLLKIESELASMRKQPQFAQNEKLAELQNSLQKYWIVKYRHFGVEDEKALVSERLTVKQIRDAAIVRKILECNSSEMVNHLFGKEYDSPEFLNARIEIVKTKINLLPQHSVERFFEQEDFLFGGIDKKVGLAEQVSVLISVVKDSFNKLREILKPYGLKELFSRIEFFIAEQVAGTDQLIASCLKCDRLTDCRNWIEKNPKITRYIALAICNGTINPDDLIEVGFDTFLKNLLSFAQEEKQDTAAAKPLKERAFAYCIYIKACLDKGWRYSSIVTLMKEQKAEQQLVQLTLFLMRQPFASCRIDYYLKVFFDQDSEKMNVDANFQRLKSSYQAFVRNLSEDKQFENTLQAVKSAAFNKFKLILKDQALHKRVELLDEARVMFCSNHRASLYQSVNTLTGEMNKYYEDALKEITGEITLKQMNGESQRELLELAILRIRVEVGMASLSGVKNSQKEAGLALEYSVLLNLKSEYLRRVKENSAVAVLSVLDDLVKKTETPAESDVLQEFRKSFLSPDKKGCLVM